MSGFEVEYALAHPDHPSPREVLDVEVGLRSFRDGFAAPRPVDRAARMRLTALPRGLMLYPSALKHVIQYLVSTFNDRGLYGVIVTLPDLEPGSGRDLREPDDTRMRLRIWTGRAADVRTFADGARFDELPSDARTNHDAHEWMREQSPVQPGGAQGLLRVAALQDYARRLSRHPGRRVDAELSAGDQPGTARVNYRVSESKPWYVYSGWSNTGTGGNTLNRQRFGLVHQQLTGRDDVLRLDYVTGDFDDVHGFYGSYEAPFTLRAPRLRFEAVGSWSRYDSSDVGLSEFDFHGEQWDAGGELRWNLLQRRAFFVDLFAGARWQNVEVENESLGLGAVDENFLLPRLGARIVRVTPTSSFAFATDLEFNLDSVAGTEREDALGTTNPDARFAILHWEGDYAFFFEPLYYGRAWKDPATPESSTLAHEVALQLRGQFAFERRLVPQHQQVAGGLHSVRGYKQSIAAGDTAVLGRAEYRLHLPRLFRPDAAPPQLPVVGEFHGRPPHVYGRPDWDFVLSAFLDAAQLFVSDPLGFEEDESLASFGGGAEIQLLRNLRARVDLGIPLASVSGRSVEPFEPRVHAAATLLY